MVIFISCSTGFLGAYKIFLGRYLDTITNNSNKVGGSNETVIKETENAIRKVIIYDQRKNMNKKNINNAMANNILYNKIYENQK
jgi:hypothetical protein